MPSLPAGALLCPVPRGGLERNSRGRRGGHGALTCIVLEEVEQDLHPPHAALPACVLVPQHAHGALHAAPQQAAGVQDLRLPEGDRARVSCHCMGDACQADRPCGGVWGAPGKAPVGAWLLSTCPGPLRTTVRWPHVLEFSARGQGKEQRRPRDSRESPHRPLSWSLVPTAGGRQKGRAPPATVSAPQAPGGEREAWLEGDPRDEKEPGLTWAPPRSAGSHSRPSEASVSMSTSAGSVGPPLSVSIGSSWPPLALCPTSAATETTPSSYCSVDGTLPVSRVRGATQWVFPAPGWWGPHGEAKDTQTSLQFACLGDLLR